MGLYRSIPSGHTLLPVCTPASRRVPDVGSGGRIDRPSSYLQGGKRVTVCRQQETRTPHLASTR